VADGAAPQLRVLLRAAAVSYIIGAMIVPVVLAAGESRRMGRPKPLLPIYETTFLSHILGVLKGVGFPTMTVVLGHEAEYIRPQAEGPGVDVVINPRYHEGQLTSLHAAIRHLAEVSPAADGLLVCLVDHPLLIPVVIRRMVAAFAREDKPIIIPTCKGRRGHPVIFGRSVFGELLDAPADQGARAVVRRLPERVLELEVGDEAILTDVDTPEHYEALRHRLMGS